MFKNKSFLAEQAIQTSLRLTQGIDTYVKKGANITQLAMQADARSHYFEPCVPLVSLLLRETNNPLVEEGDYSNPSNRMRQGEYYLTYEAITLLIEKKIRHHRSSKNSLPYNSRNIYVIKNDIGNLQYILAGLNLDLDDDAKIIYIAGIHSIPIYLCNQQGIIRCFIVDSEANVNPFPNSIITILYEVFPQIEVVVSTTTLQRDYYSCSTFAIKALMYFVKHGADIFPWVDASKTTKKHYGQQSCHALDPENLMPALLKMGQTRLSLSSDILATIVSTKQKLTLRDYFQRYTLNFAADESLALGQFSKQNVNSAALVKKYHYFTLLNTYLQQMTQDPISRNAYQDLPVSIQKRVNHYAIFHGEKKKKSIINPIDAYLDIVLCLDNIIPILNKNSQMLLTKIQCNYPTYHQLYVSFTKDTWLKNTEKLNLKKLFFVAALSESNTINALNIYDDFLIKLETFFLGDSAMIMSYLRHHAIAHSKQPLHDLCLFMMPNTRNWNKAYWAELVVQYGMKATRYLALASQIDTLLIEHAAERNNDSVNELAWIKHLLDHFSYKQADKNKKLAALCVRFNRSESQFEDSLALVSHRAKSFDFLPEMTLHGGDLDERLARFTFAKLAVDDLRGLFLGEYTSCCQSLHKMGAYCAVHGMTSPFGGFYVVYDNKTIIAQSWVWIGKGGEIVFDSWEFINKNQSYLCKPFMLKAAEQFIHAGFTKVLLGQGGNTPDLPFVSADKPVAFPLPDSYSDADRQYLIQSSPYQTKLARFKAFTEYLNILELYTNCCHLLDESLDTDAIATQLSQLIATNKLSFDHFFKLTKFLYICQHEVLHQNNELLLIAIEIYGSQMLPLFSLHTITGSSALTSIMACDDTNSLTSIVLGLCDKDYQSAAITVQKQLIQSLLFDAATFNAVRNLEYLASLFATLGSYDELAALTNDNKQSLLFYSAAHNAFQCVEFMLARMQNKAILSDLLSYQDREGTIIHLLAKANQLAIFQLIEHLCLGNDVISKLLDDRIYYRFSGQQGRQYSMCADVKSVVFVSGSYDLLRYLLDHWSGGATKKQQVDYLLRMIPPSTLESVLTSGDIKGLTFLHSMHHNEKHWLDSLVSLQTNPLTTALRVGQFDCALFLIDSLLHIDHLHQLLTYSGSDPWLKFLPLDHVADDITPSQREQLLRKILTIYAPYRHKANALFCTRSHAILSGLIKSKNDNLFKEALVYLAQDTELFEAVLFIDSYSCISPEHKDNLLDSLIKSKPPEEDEQAIETFIDILFDVTSLEQQKKMLLELRSLDIIPSKININYLLQKVDKIGDESFRRQWANFKNKSPLMRAMYNLNSAVTITMIDYYISLYTLDRIKAFLSEHWRIVADRVIDDMMLLNHIYPMLKNAPKKLKEIFLIPSSIQMRKFILIKLSTADRHDLLAMLTARSVFAEDIDKSKDTMGIQTVFDFLSEKSREAVSMKTVSDYINFLTKVDILRDLKHSLSQQRPLKAGMSFFQQPDSRQDAIYGLFATFNDTLFYFDDSNQLIFTDPKPIHECWQAVKDVLSEMVVSQATDELTAIYQHYYKQMTKVESPDDESLTISLAMQP